MSEVYGIILASGFSRRFGSDKLSQELCGKPVIQWCIDQVLSSGASMVYVIIRESKGGYHIRADPKVRFILNEDPATGMSSSIRAAITKMDGNPDAVIIVNGDMPFFGVENYRKLIGLWQATHDGISSSYYSGETMPPAVFSRRFFSDLIELQGDRGAKRIIQKNLSEVKFLSIEDPDTLMDIDTIEDLVYARSMCNRLLD